jgi:hypothetical protein
VVAKILNVLENKYTTPTPSYAIIQWERILAILINFAHLGNKGIK